MKYEGKIYGKVAGKYIQLDVNPNLVDAAPELLAALKRLIEVMPTSYIHFTDQRDAADAALSAIEKAEKI